MCVGSFEINFVFVSIFKFKLRVVDVEEGFSELEIVYCVYFVLELCGERFAVRNFLSFFKWIY